MRVRGWGLAKTNLPWGWSGAEGARKQTRANKGGVGVKTRESWANVLFEWPLILMMMIMCNMTISAEAKLFMNFNFKHNFNKLWDMEPLNFVKIMITFSYGARKCKQSCRMLTKISLFVLIHKIWIKVSRNWQELENTLENYVI